MYDVPGIVISAAVEGLTDQAVTQRLIQHIGAQPGQVYGREGKDHLRARIQGYNNAARQSPWLVLVDLDHTYECAASLRADWLPRQTQASRLCFRVAVRSIEAWLLADAAGIAAFLGVSASKVTPMPESLPNPKAALVSLAQSSRKRELRLDMVPTASSGRQIGPAYTSRLIQFISEHWQPDVASQRSDSLKRAIQCLRQLAV